MIRLVLISLLLTLISGCVAVNQVPRRPAVESVILPASLPAVTALLQKADYYAGNQDIEQALYTLEWGINIDGSDPVSWYQSANYYYLQQDYKQAIAYARRAASLSASFPSLRRGCLRLTAKAYTAMGEIRQAALASQTADNI